MQQVKASCTSLRAGLPKGVLRDSPAERLKPHLSGKSTECLALAPSTTKAIRSKGQNADAGAVGSCSEFSGDPAQPAIECPFLLRSGGLGDRLSALVIVAHLQQALLH